MDIKKVFVHHSDMTSAQDSSVCINPIESDYSTDASDDIDRTSSCSQNNTTRSSDSAQIIRIPTGQNFNTDSKPHDGDSSSDITPTITINSQDEQICRVLPLCSDTDETDSNAVVRVRRPRTCEWGPELKASQMTPVTDLVSRCPDLAQAQVEAVPLGQHFYNQWARLPRILDPEGCDVTTGTRRPTSLRMLPATGSLKSYTLMNAIVRDKSSPIENYANLFHNFKAGTAAGAGDSRRAATPQDASLLARSGCTRSAGSGTPWRSDGDALPPIVDFRPETALGTMDSESKSFPKDFLPLPSLTSRQDKNFSPNLLSVGSGKQSVLGARVEKKGDLTGLWTKRPRWRCAGGPVSHSASSQRPQQCLPMNRASLLFSKDVDMREQRYSGRFAKKRSRSAFKSKQHPEQVSEETGEGSSARTKGRADNGKDGGSSNGIPNKPVEMKCAQFIDFTEVKQILLKDKTSEMKVDGVDRLETLSASSRGRRASSSASAYRHYGGRQHYTGETNAAPSLSGGFHLNISAIKSAAE